MIRVAARSLLAWRCTLGASAALVALAAAACAGAGPQYPPTKGAVWPKPSEQKLHPEYFLFNPTSFRVRISNHRCTILINAVQRYIKTMNIYDNIIKKGRKYKPDEIPSDKYFQGIAKELMIKLTKPCETYPYYGMSESYSLTVKAQTLLESGSIWGILRGLETFAQLYYLSDDFTQIYINATEITDAPRYLHRGLLLDTARHFLSVDNVLLTLDAMAMNKLNILHWHIVDDESFPYESEHIPLLSKKGAYHPSMVYTKENITKIINYARDRGIRVVPEFDIPGHTRSWGAAFPDILTKCYDDHGRETGLGPLNPIGERTYKILRPLLAEVQTLFVDDHLHIGGDEVNIDCWRSNPALTEYLVRHKMDVRKLREMFTMSLLPMLSNHTKPVVWQDVFTAGIPIPKNTLVQIWKDDGSMLKALRAGHRVVFSASWYLDHLDYSLPRLFLWEPRASVLRATHNAELAERVVGGEAAVWGHLIDDTNVITRVWPRACGVAEVLWSRGLSLNAAGAGAGGAGAGGAGARGAGAAGAGAAGAATLGGAWGAGAALREARRRLEEHTCRMQRARLPAEPASGPGYCFM